MRCGGPRLIEIRLFLQKHPEIAKRICTFLMFNKEATQGAFDVTFGRTVTHLSPKVLADKASQPIGSFIALKEGPFKGISLRFVRWTFFCNLETASGFHFFKKVSGRGIFGAFFFRDRVTLNIDKTWFKMDCLQNLWRIVRIVVGHRWDWDDAAFFFSLEQDPGLVSQFGCWHLHRLCHRLRRFGGNEAAAESWISQLKFLYNPVYGGSVHQLCDRLFLRPSFQQKVLSKLGFSRFFFKEWCAYWIQLCDFGIKER